MSLSTRSSITLAVAGTLLGVAPTVRAADLVVDGQGGAGTFRTIQAAIDAAAIGDRILVRPGIYDGFAVTKSVAVLGTGADAAAVRVRGIGFHPVFPHSGYRVQLSRLTVGLPNGPSADTDLSLSGNELGGGQLDLDSVVFDGGIFLGVGDSGFQLTFANCEVIPDPAGAGIDGATVNVEGPGVRIEVQRSTIQGARGAVFPVQLPLAALAIDEGAVLRIAQSQLTGGNGASGQPGAPALLVRNGQVAALHAETHLVGGRGGAGAAGGPAVRSDRPVLVGSATLRGGDGTPPGPQFDGRGSLLQLDPREPALTLVVDGSSVGPLAARPGSSVTWRLSEPAGNGVIVTADAVRVAAAPFTDLSVDPAASLWLVHRSTTLVVPGLPPTVGLVLYSQGVVLDVAAGSVRASTPTSLRIDG